MSSSNNNSSSSDIITSDDENELVALVEWLQIQHPIVTDITSGETVFQSVMNGLSTPEWTQ
jgi:hypothetical protein